MAWIHPSILACRNAVRRTLTEVRSECGSDALVFVACSGGADSLALAAATAFVGPREKLRVGLITVDHALQAGSAERAAKVAAWGHSYGFDPAEAVAVEVDGRSVGMEAAAREARYAALASAAERCGAAAVLLGHTRDDQAETVLLAFARGAGPRGIAGMPYSRPGDASFGRAERDVVTGSSSDVEASPAEDSRWRYYRPLLHLPRRDTREACKALGLVAWEDPHNSDPAYTRARVRALLPQLEETLGPGFVPNLARTAHMVAADVQELDRIAAEAMRNVLEEDSHALVVERLASYPTATRRRVLHIWLRSLGVPWGAITGKHIDAVDVLVIAWSGQGPVHLPNAIRVRRAEGRLLDAS